MHLKKVKETTVIEVTKEGSLNTVVHEDSIR